jgi:outer membrane protein assembly factor BamB
MGKLKQTVLCLGIIALAAVSATSEDVAGPQERLWAAARQGDVAAVKALLDAGVDPDAEFREGGTALLFAAQRGHAGVVELLLERGADVHGKEHLNDWTALHFGIAYPEVVRILVARGADVDAREAQSNHASLWWAVVRRQPESARILLDSGRLGALALEDGLEAAEATGQAELAAAIRAALAKADTAAKWPQFRGPRAAGVADGEALPLTWDAEKGVNVRWQTPIPGLGHSSPVVWGDRLFVTTAVSSNPETDLRAGSPMESAADMSPHAFKVYCLDRHTGKVLWERTAWEGVPRTKRNPKNSFASPTPVTDGRHLVAMFGSHGLYGYDLDGKLLWKKDLGVLDSGFFFDPAYQWGDASSPVIWRDTVILQADLQKGSFLAAFALADGVQRWRTERDELPAWATPTIYEGPGRPEIVTNGIRQVRGYDPDTGKELWHLATDNSKVAAATPVVSPDLFLVGNGYRPLKPLYAIRPGASGDISLGDATSNASVLWSKRSGGPYYVTPLLYRDHLYVLSEPGILTVYYAKTGEEIYRHRVGDSGATFSASPVAADGHLFLAGEDGRVYVVKAGIEYQLEAANPVGELTMATPAIAGGMLYVRTRHRVLGIGATPPAP